MPHSRTSLPGRLASDESSRRAIIKSQAIQAIEAATLGDIEVAGRPISRAGRKKFFNEPGYRSIASSGSSRFRGDAIKKRIETSRAEISGAWLMRPLPPACSEPATLRLDPRVPRFPSAPSEPEALLNQRSQPEKNKSSHYSRGPGNMDREMMKKKGKER